MVYFVRCGEFVKIGTSENVEKRLAGLQTSSPYELDLEGTIPGERRLEQRIHFENRSKNSQGEWFKLTKDEVKDIISKHAESFEKEKESHDVITELNKFIEMPNAEMFSATDLVKAGRMECFSSIGRLFSLSAWLNTESTQEFIAELEKEFGKTVVKSQNGSHTWVHPLLFIDLALALSAAISPKLKIEVYEWLLDHDGEAIRIALERTQTPL